VFFADLASVSRAKELVTKAHSQRINFEGFLRKEEEARQVEERRKCGEAFKLRIEAFNKEWDAKHEECEAQCAKNVRDFEEIADGRRKALELSIKRTPMKKVVISTLYFCRSIRPLGGHARAFRLQLCCLQLTFSSQVYSSEIRDYRIMEKKCANGGEFEMAKRYNRSIEKQARVCVCMYMHQHTRPLPFQ
jgi:hypothetical protein